MCSVVDMHIVKYWELSDVEGWKLIIFSYCFVLPAIGIVLPLALDDFKLIKIENL